MNVRAVRSLWQMRLITGWGRTAKAVCLPPEQPGASNAADACADSVEESNSKRPNLDPEGLADREIGGTRSSRGEEEDCFLVTLPCAAPSSTANAAAHYSLSM